MDIEEIVDTLAKKEEINKVKWSGKMPEGVNSVWKEYPSSRPGDLYADGIRPYSTEYIIHLTDRINYDVIKKICDNSKLTVHVKDAEVNEKGSYPINYSIYENKIKTKMETLHVNDDVFSFYISSESVRVKRKGKEAFVLKRETVKEGGKKVSKLIKYYKGPEPVPDHITLKKRGKKALKVIKAYLSKVHGEG